MTTHTTDTLATLNRLSAAGLSLNPGRMLLHLLGGPMSVTELSQACSITPSAAGGMIQAMVDRGLVNRVYPATDRRKILIRLTTAGVGVANVLSQ